ncbi:DNA protecting protein DprA [Thermanaerovibrio velox DSM 12556]|uniref:DNA protecting protein DprA n=1 Tax=Thermanaerovibrio velox DSM 12556 TaxID=926567 RepID=H0UPN1_9BACT|nr:DNA-processing protein DprA [Thermanaerovibrio velox]EHM09578.1 DNA protecting protein DprA [Thermanaerovibrio velox DSM 12556]
MDRDSMRAFLCLNRLFEGRAGHHLRRWVEGGGVPRDLLMSPKGFSQGGFKEDIFPKASSLFSSPWADREMERCHEIGVDLLFMGHGGYPGQLMDLKSPPAVLYVRGALRVPGSLGDGVAVVGTRRASGYALRVARCIGEFLGSRGIWTLSGGAEGVDGAAHDGALRSGGATCAVLGTGVDVVFPASHGELFRRITESGCLVSEYPLGTKGAQWRFPLRNRILAALAGRTVVVEAPRRSGALITASHALELGREVWAVPGRIGEPPCEGSNMLIYDGALALADIRLLDLSGGSGAADGAGEDGAGCREASLDPVDGVILKLLAQKGERTVDNLAVECKIGAADLMSRLCVLEARGVVYSPSPGRFSLSPHAPGRLRGMGC